MCPPIQLAILDIPLHNSRAFGDVNGQAVGKWISPAGSAHCIAILETHSDVEDGGLEFTVGDECESHVTDLDKVGLLLLLSFYNRSSHAHSSTSFSWPS